MAVALEKAGALERLIASLFAFARTEYLEQPPRREALELGDLLRARIIDNLLDNAVRQTPPGGTVTLGWHSAGDAGGRQSPAGPG